VRRIIWRGDQQEALELLGAVARHCTCAIDARGLRYSSCPSHRMLVEDQRALDGLLFARWLADRLRGEEFGPPGARHDWPPYHFTPLDRSAKGVEEFLAICRAERAVAEQHLRSGYFEPWLQDIGRTSPRWRRGCAAPDSSTSSAPRPCRPAPADRTTTRSSADRPLFAQPDRAGRGRAAATSC
jgi:hypothetical protein